MTPITQTMGFVNDESAQEIVLVKSRQHLLEGTGVAKLFRRHVQQADPPVGRCGKQSTVDVSLLSFIILRGVQKDRLDSQLCHALNLVLNERQERRYDN